MPVETRSIENEGFCLIHPNDVDWLSDIGLRTGRDFLNWPGVVVNGHVDRNVSRVQLGDVVGYLKVEHRIRLRDRLRSVADGFGYGCKSRREAIVIARLQINNLPAPNWLAAGEVDGKAFLLVEEAEGAVELRALKRVSNPVARSLGNAIGRMHEVGIHQPDLFAKHILVNSRSRQITIIDWQQAELRSKVHSIFRIRALAVLHATAIDDPTSPPAWWSVFLKAYLGATGLSLDTLDEFATEVARRSARIRNKPSIRRQREQKANVEQPLMRINGEDVCAIPEVADSFRSPTAVARVYNPASNGQPLAFAKDRTGLLLSRRYSAPFGRWWAKLRGKAWRSPELRRARLLFHLQRHGIAAPQLLAYGQRITGFRTAESFVLEEVSPREPLAAGDREAALELAQRLADAGVAVLDARALGQIDGQLGVVDVSHLRLAKKVRASRLQRSLAQIAEAAR